MDRCLICLGELGRTTKRINGYDIRFCPYCESYTAVENGTKKKPDYFYFYDDRAASIGTWLSWAHTSFLDKYDGKGKTLLDLGTGSGEFIQAACEKGIDAYGVDFDKRVTDAGNKHYKFERLQSADMVEFLKSTSQKWDAITLFATIEHLKDPNEIMRLVVAHLKDNGTISITVQNMNMFCHWWALATRGNDYPPNHYTRWSRKGLEIFCKR